MLDTKQRGNERQLKNDVKKKNSLSLVGLS